MGSSSPHPALQALCAAQPPGEVGEGGQNSWWPLVWLEVPRARPEECSRGQQEGPPPREPLHISSLGRRLRAAQALPRRYSFSSGPGAALADGVRRAREGLPDSPPASISAPCGLSHLSQPWTGASHALHLCWPCPHLQPQSLVQPSHPCPHPEGQPLAVGFGYPSGVPADLRGLRFSLKRPTDQIFPA